MGKHDKENAYRADVMPDEFYKEHIKLLENKLAFANETISKQRDENAKYGKWVNQMDANAQDVIAEKDKRIAELEEKIVKLVTAYV